MMADSTLEKYFNSIIIKELEKIAFFINDNQKKDIANTLIIVRKFYDIFFRWIYFLKGWDKK